MRHVPIDAECKTKQIKLIRMHVVSEHTGLSKSYIYQLAASGKFPQPVELIPGGKAKGWVESEVLSWLEARVAERDGGEK